MERKTELMFWWPWMKQVRRMKVKYTEVVRMKQKTAILREVNLKSLMVQTSMQVKMRSPIMKLQSSRSQAAKIPLPRRSPMMSMTLIFILQKNCSLMYLKVQTSSVKHTMTEKIPQMADRIRTTKEMMAVDSSMGENTKQTMMASTTHKPTIEQYPISNSVFQDSVLACLEAQAITTKEQKMRMIMPASNSFTTPQWQQIRLQENV